MKTKAPRASKLNWACFLALMGFAVYHRVHPLGGNTPFTLLIAGCLLAGFVAGLASDSARSARFDHETGATDDFRLKCVDTSCWHERTIAHRDHLITVMLDDDEENFGRSLPHANYLIEHADLVFASLEEFMRKPHAGHPQWAEDREDLAVDMILFLDEERPDTAKFCFVEAFSRHLWACTYRNGKFSDLRLDDDE